MDRTLFAAGFIRRHFPRIKSADVPDLERRQISSSLHHLGRISEEEGDFDGAESHYRASLCLNRRIHGQDADHPDIASSLHQLGGILDKKGDFDEAELQYGAVLCMNRHIHGEDADHPSIAASLHELGHILEE